MIIYSGKINEYWKYCGIATKISSLRKFKTNYIIYEPIMEFLIIINNGEVMYYHSTPEWFNNEITLRMPTVDEFLDTIDPDNLLKDQYELIKKINL
jgi:hypothetical protein